MYTRCPSCLTCFRATEHHLAIAGGKVRCGQCQLVFNATEHAVDDLPINQLSNPVPTANNADINEASVTEVKINKKTTPDTSDNKPIEEEQINLSSDFNSELEQDEIDQNTKPSSEDFEEPIEKSSPFAQETLNEAKELAQGVEVDLDDELPKEDNALDKELLHEKDMEEIKEEKEQPLLIDIPEQVSEEEFEILDIVDDVFDEKKIDNTDEKVESTLDNNDDSKTNERTEEIESDATYNGESFEIIDSAPPLENTTTEQEAEDNEVPVQLRDDIERLQQPSARRLHPALSLLFILILFTISFLQLAYFRAFELTFAIPSATPYIEMFCDKVNCNYSGPLDKKKIQLLSRDVRVHPKEKKALLISAAMINNASFAQPYPNIKIRLSDISGNVVAERIFTSKTYIGNATNPFSLMKSKIPVHIKFEVVDPGKDAVNFEFNFL